MAHSKMSFLEKLRTEYRSPLPPIFANLSKAVLEKQTIPCYKKEIQELFPLFSNLPILTGSLGRPRNPRAQRIGVLFSGGPAPGGHNVLAALFDTLQGGVLLGFLDGPKGLLEGNYKELSKEDIDNKRNLGGFDLIGSGRIKISNEADLEKTLICVKALALDGLVIIGGDDSNTNAAILADFFKKKECKTTVIGVPKTIDADLKNAYLACSFGFDTACKVYSEIIGNICKDALSSKKYTHFIKLMGREASHITLECALKTKPNYTLIGEEVEKERKSLLDITLEITDLIVARAKNGKNYSIILLPEGILHFIPELKNLLIELDSLIPKGLPIEHLSKEAKRCFDYLPKKIQKQLLLEKDEHGNLPLSMIETEELFADLVSYELKKREEDGRFKGEFRPMTHFLGYEGRCAIPSNFDADYAYALGIAAALLIQEKATGYIACIHNLDKSKEQWVPGGIPIFSMMQMEMRKGVLQPVIQKTIVDLHGGPFRYFASKRVSWSIEDEYISPGPMQFYLGETDSLPLSLTLNIETLWKI